MSPEARKVLNKNDTAAREMLPKLTDEQLNEVVQYAAVSRNLYTYALDEQNRRAIGKALHHLKAAHWTTRWTFWVALAAAVFAAIAAIDVLIRWFHH